MMSMTDQAPELLPDKEAHDVIVAYFDSCGLNNAKAGASNILAMLKDAGLVFTRPTPAERPDPQVREALEKVRQELWVDYCLRMGRTDTDPAPFNAKPVIRIIDAALTARPSDAAVAWQRRYKASLVASWETIPDERAHMRHDMERQGWEIRPLFALLPDEPARVTEMKLVYIKRWRTIVPLPATYADEIVEALRITPIAELPPMEALPLSVGFAVEYLDGVMTEEQAEIQRMWKLVRTHIMSVSVTPSTVGGEALDAPEPNVDVLPDGRCIPAISDDALWALAATLHSNVPEDKRPMSWSDFSPEQVERLRLAAKALLGKLSPTIASEKECGKAVGEWRDIASAPRDGTNVLLTGDRWTAVGAYWPCNSHWTETMASGMKLNSPTHWQPLPALPAASLIAKG